MVIYWVSHEDSWSLGLILAFITSLILIAIGFSLPDPTRYITRDTTAITMFSKVMFVMLMMLIASTVVYCILGYNPIVSGYIDGVLVITMVLNYAVIYVMGYSISSILPILLIVNYDSSSSAILDWGQLVALGLLIKYFKRLLNILRR